MTLSVILELPEDSEECPVCQEAKLDPLYTIPCKHEFCKKCCTNLVKHYENSPPCPLCRTKVDKFKKAHNHTDDETVSLEISDGVSVDLTQPSRRPLCPAACYSKLCQYLLFYILSIVFFGLCRLGLWVWENYVGPEVRLLFSNSTYYETFLL